MLEQKLNEKLKEAESFTHQRKIKSGVKAGLLGALTGLIIGIVTAIYARSIGLGPIDGIIAGNIGLTAMGAGSGVFLGVSVFEKKKNKLLAEIDDLRQELKNENEQAIQQELEVDVIKEKIEDITKTQEKVKVEDKENLDEEEITIG